MSRLRRRGFLAACGAALLGGCSAVVDRPATDAPAATAGPSTTEPPTPEETPSVEVTRTSTGGVESRWDTFVPGRYTLSSPAVTGDGLYIGSDREVRRLALSDGAVEWEAPLGALTHGFSPAVGNGVVYAAARDMVGGSLLDDTDSAGAVAALAAGDGTERWRTVLRVTADPTLAGGSVVVPTTDGGAANLRALGVDDGTERWRAHLGSGRALAAPAVAGDRVIVPATREDAGRVVAVAPADGSERWALDTGPVVAPAVAADGVVYAATSGGTLHALAATDGTERWRRSLDGGIYTRPAVDGDTLYVASGDAVRALAAGDGTEQWRAAVGDVGRTGLTVADGRVYVGGARVTALDAASGERAWSQELSGVAGTFGAPAVRAGVLYTGACVKREGNDPYDHHVYALAETDG